MSTCADFFLAILAILFPPLAGKCQFISCMHPLPIVIQRLRLVWIKRGICSADSLLNLLLLILGYVPGLIHAWYIIARYPEDYEPVTGHDPEDGRVTYYYVSRDTLPPPQPGPAASGAPDGGKAHRQLQRGPSYGAINAQAQNSAQAPASSSQANQANASQSQQGPEGSAKPPPTYAEAIKGDNKIQTS